MAATEQGVVTQKAPVPLLYFASLLNKRLGGPGNMKVYSIHCCFNGQCFQ